MSDIPAIDLGELGVSLSTGFIPETVFERLPNNYYEPWEELIRALPNLIASRQLRREVDEQLPVLSTVHLKTPAEWRRASTILSYIMHAYIWESEPANRVVPPSIAEPFLSTCEATGMPPVQTYANLVLWNTTPKEEARTKAPADLEYHDLETMFSFTGTPDEAWFYLASAAVEIKGTKVIAAMINAQQNMLLGEEVAAAEELNRCAETLESVIPLVFRRVHERCDPDCFYNRVRPFLAGSNAVQVGTDPNGISLRRLDGRTEHYTLPGGSNAQGSLLQLCDLVLGVDFDAAQLAFFNDMRRYMPREHRSLLERVESRGSIAKLVKASPLPSLRDAWTRCIVALKDLRKSHIGLVARYIVVPSRRDQKHVAVLGTAGSSPMQFLQKVRDQTALSVAAKT